MTAEEVVQVELARYKAGFDLEGREEEVALLLSDEMDRVSEIIGPSTRNPQGAPDPYLAWLFSAGMELLSLWRNSSSPGEDLYEILEALGLDEEFSDLVNFTPVGMFKRTRSSDYLGHKLRNRLEELRPSLLT